MATDSMATELMDNFLCIKYNNGELAFPCSATAIQASSLGLAGGGAALLFTLFLTHKVILSNFIVVPTTGRLLAKWCRLQA